MPDISLLADMPRGDPTRNLTDFAPPGACFFNPAALEQPRFAYGGSGMFSRRPAESLFLGVVNGTVREGRNGNRYVTGGRAIGYLDDRHFVTIAGSRAGKGRSAIVPNMLRYPGSVLATDPKGELASLTARPRCERLGHDVHVLDPFGEVTGPALHYARDAGFNPMAAMADAGEETRMELASLIGDALVQISEREPHWDEAARSFIEGVILHVATHAHYEDRRNLVTVHGLIGLGVAAPPGEDPMARLRAQMETNEAGGRPVKMAAAEFFQKPDRERGSVLSMARRHLRFLGYPGIQRIVTQHNFKLEDLKGRPTTIYLCLPARHMGTCARWLRLFVNLTLQAMERDKRRPANGLPVLLALDEFATLGHMHQVEIAAGQIAGFGVKLWPVLQDLGQLKALYKDRWETFLGNAGVLQFFGNNDLSTLEWISKRCGKATIRVRNDVPRTEDQKHAGASGESWSNEIHDLLSIDEAARVFAREDKLLRQMLIIGGGKPIVLQRAFYDTHELFAGMAEEL